MNINEILFESWATRFDEIERHIRVNETTVKELKEYLNQKFSIYLILVPHSIRSVDPFQADGGAVHLKRHSAKTKDSPYPKDAHGKYVMEINVGPGVRPTTPVKEITGFLRLLRHELTHSMQNKGKFDFSDYAEADTTHRKTDPVAHATYVLQNAERPAHVLDLAQFLSQLDVTPQQFFATLTKAKAIVKAETQNHHSADDINFKHLRAEIKRLTYREFTNSTNKKSEQIKSGFKDAYRYIHYYLETLSIALVLSPERDKLKNQFNSFRRLLLKQFKSISASERSNRADGVAAHKKNTPRRKAQLRNAIAQAAQAKSS